MVSSSDSLVPVLPGAVGSLLGIRLEVDVSVSPSPNYLNPWTLDALNPELRIRPARRLNP